MTFAYSDETMTLQPNSIIAKRDNYDRSGMLLVDKNDKIVVYDVRRGTPAAKAGLTKGNAILSIEGVVPHSLEQARRALRGAPNPR